MNDIELGFAAAGVLLALIGVFLAWLWRPDSPDRKD